MEENKQPFMLLPTMESRIITGILSFTGIIILLAWVAINENARMQEFTERFEGRSIESGAILFENNCSTCHGQLGYGQTGVAPALNSPHFFSYNYFEEFDQQLTLLEGQLESGELSVEEAAEIEAQIEQISRARLELEEELLYDYSEITAQLDAELADLDASIIEQYGDEYGIVSASLLGSTVTQLEAQIADLEAELQTTTDPDRADEIAAELEVLNNDLDTLSQVNNERTILAARTNRFRALTNAHVDVQTIRGQIDSLTAELNDLPEAPADGIDPDAARRTELEAQIDVLEDQLSAAEDTRSDARDELIVNAEIIPFDTERYEQGRLTEVGWGGTLESFIYTTLVSGRPTSGSYWPQGMAAWSQEASGPLRGDQIQNLTDYILNWEKEEWTVADTRLVQQYAIIPAADGGGDAASGAEPICTTSNCDDIADVVADLEALQEDSGEAGEEGVTVWDPIAGQSSYTSLGCAGCHVAAGGGSGPSPVGIYTRAGTYAAENDDIESERYYIVQSIIHPNDFIAPGYGGNIMPGVYGDQLDIATFSNIVAYLETQDQAE